MRKRIKRIEEYEISGSELAILYKMWDSGKSFTYDGIVDFIYSDKEFVKLNKRACKEKRLMKAFDRLIKLKLIASSENDGYYLPTRDKDDYLNKHTAYIWL